MTDPPRLVTLAAEDDFDGWRSAARSLAIAGVAPADIVWRVGDAPADLFAADAAQPAASAAFSVPRQFVELAQSAICHADPERFALLYTLLTRLRATPRLLSDAADPLVRRIEGMAKSVRRDSHKMHAFVRFREVGEGEEARYVAWFEPEHHIVRINAGFFVRRFTNMRWSILTPELSIHWDGETVTESPGATRADAPAGDPVEEIWRTYYAAIFNPARVKVKAMLKEMPKKYWANMPETALVPGLIAGAEARERGMIERSQPLDPEHTTPGGARSGDPTEVHEHLRGGLAELAGEAKHCTRCPLYGPATQMVFGEGPKSAKLMLVGEQPGDQEDLAGRPFVGPAGQVLDRALAAAGIDRSRAYVTNAVKHFKFEPRGKRRIHAKPNGQEIEACRWWLDQERAAIRPPVTVALGASAAQALLGQTVTIGRSRGRAMTLADGGECWVTVHPSYLLRIDDRDRAEEEFGRMVADLKLALASAERHGR